MSEVVPGAALIERVEVRYGECDVEEPEVLDGHDVGDGLGVFGGVRMSFVLCHAHVLIFDT